MKLAQKIKTIQETNISGDTISDPKKFPIKDASINIITGLTPKDLALAPDDDDLILIIKTTGEMLCIQSHFAPSGQHRVNSIDFADSFRLMLNNHTPLNHGLRSISKIRLVSTEIEV